MPKTTDSRPIWQDALDERERLEQQYVDVLALQDTAQVDLARIRQAGDARQVDDKLVHDAAEKRIVLALADQARDVDGADEELVDAENNLEQVDADAKDALRRIKAYARARDQIGEDIKALHIRERASFEAWASSLADEADEAWSALQPHYRTAFEAHQRAQLAWGTFIDDLPAKPLNPTVFYTPTEEPALSDPPKWPHLPPREFAHPRRTVRRGSEVVPVSRTPRPPELAPEPVVNDPDTINIYRRHRDGTRLAVPTGGVLDQQLALDGAVQFVETRARKRQSA